MNSWSRTLSDGLRSGYLRLSIFLIDCGFDCLDCPVERWKNSSNVKYENNLSNVKYENKVCHEFDFWMPYAHNWLLSYPDNNSPILTIASEKNYLSIVKKIVSLSGSYIKDIQPDHCNGVCASIANGNLEIFCFLIEFGFNIEICAFHMSILCGKYNILEYIFDNKHSVPISFDYLEWYTGLQYHILHKNLESVLILLKNMNKEVIKLDNNKRHPLVMLAAQEDFSIVLSYLIENGFNIETESSFGGNALLLASNKGIIDIVKILCENRANVNTTDNELKSPLHHAAENGHIDVVKLLIQYHANLSIKCRDGLTPLDYSIKNNHNEIENYLKSIDKQEEHF